MALINSDDKVKRVVPGGIKNAILFRNEYVPELSLENEICILRFFTLLQSSKSLLPQTTSLLNGLCIPLKELTLLPAIVYAPKFKDSETGPVCAEKYVLAEGGPGRETMGRDIFILLIGFFSFINFYG